MLLDDALPGGGSAERPAPHKAKTAPTHSRELTPESWTGLILIGYGCKGLSPVVLGGKALDPLLDSVGVVPGDIPVNSLGKLVDASKVLAVIHLCFQMSEEILHDSVVITVTLTRHGLDGTGLFDKPAPAEMVIVDTSIGVHQQPFARLMLLQRGTQRRRSQHR